MPLPGAVSSVLARIISLAGQVAFRQTVFVEVDILTEMKRRQAAMEESRVKGKSRKSKADSSKVKCSKCGVYRNVKRC